MRKNISHKTYFDHWISTKKYCVVISSSITVLILSISLLTLNCDKFVRAFYGVLWAAILRAATSKDQSLHRIHKEIITKARTSMISDKDKCRYNGLIS